MGKRKITPQRIIPSETQIRLLFATGEQSSSQLADDMRHNYAASRKPVRCVVGGIELVANANGVTVRLIGRQPVQ